MQNADGRPPAVAGPAYRHAHDEVRIRPGIEPETRCSGPGRAAARGRRRRSTDRGRIGCRQSAGADQLLDELVAGDVLVGTALDRLGRVGRSLIALVDDLTSRPRDSDKKAGARPARRRTRGAGRAALARRLDLQGVIPEHADQAVRYLAKYLTKAIGKPTAPARTWPSAAPRPAPHRAAVAALPHPRRVPGRACVSTTGAGEEVGLTWEAKAQWGVECLPGCGRLARACDGGSQE